MTDELHRLIAKLGLADHLRQYCDAYKAMRSINLIPPRRQPEPIVVFIPTVSETTPAHSAPMFHIPTATA